MPPSQNVVWLPILHPTMEQFGSSWADIPAGRFEVFGFHEDLQMCIGRRVAFLECSSTPDLLLESGFLIGQRCQIVCTEPVRASLRASLEALRNTRKYCTISFKSRITRPSKLPKCNGPCDNTKKKDFYQVPATGRRPFILEALQEDRVTAVTAKTKSRSAESRIINATSLKQKTTERARGARRIGASAGAERESRCGANINPGHRLLCGERSVRNLKWSSK
jgi:hypothetical protein